MKESCFIDTINLEELGVVTKVPEEPVESPEGSLCAVQAAREGAGFERLGFQYKELDFDKRFSWMPLIVGAVHANEK